MCTLAFKSLNRASARACHKKGFTLVELLVVIAIIGILVALLLPAVQAAREAARRSQCKNNLKNIALGCLLHVDAYKFMPSGGWGFNWSGDPNRGFGEDQPGSWAYNILPFVEEQSLHDLGKGATPGSQAYTDALTTLNSTPVGLFICPSRRAVKTYRGNWTTTSDEMKFLTALSKGEGVAKSDYAASAGSSREWDTTEMGGALAKNYAALATIKWPLTNICGRSLQGTSVFTENFRHCQSGISYLRSEVKNSMIVDGTSSTYLVGEKYISTDNYEPSDVTFSSGFGLDDNQGIYAGYDWDMTRVAYESSGTEFPPSGGTLVPSAPDAYLPRQDTPGTGNTAYAAFGSSHTGGLNMSFCDGSVRTVSYDIDGKVHRNQANRFDGEVVVDNQ